MKYLLISLIVTLNLIAQPHFPFEKLKPFTIKEFSTISINEDSSYFEANVKYPHTGYADLDEKIKEWVDMIYESTKYDCEFLKELEVKDGRKGSLLLEYQVIPTGKNLLNISINGYNYTGGAHGMPIQATFLYDLVQNKNLSLNNLFKKNANYLGKASKFCKKALKKFFKEQDFPTPEWFNDGSDPDEANYFTFLVKDDGIYFYFAPYQITAYAFGSFWVRVPHSEFRKLYLSNYKF